MKKKLGVNQSSEEGTIPFTFGSRRGIYVDISQDINCAKTQLSISDKECFEIFDLLYRSLCAILYNYVPLSGHPGGAISSGRFVAAILFETMDYDVSDPDRRDADVLSYAAGHKALGLYAMWALRNEIMRIKAPELLPNNQEFQLRLEDLLGFRKNPLTQTPLFRKYKAKSLDGHPTPLVPFVRLATGASGVGLASSIGLGFAAMDYFAHNAPIIHIVEGEGGLTPGRVSESLSAAGTSSLKNIVLHIDWNQASIDSDHVCRSGQKPGDYVQWDPCELLYLHDWNVIYVPDGTDYHQIIAAQKQAFRFENSQPTAIVYRTIKGWKYGIEGKQSHGAGHSLCSVGFLESLKPFLSLTNSNKSFPQCKENSQQCNSGRKCLVLEECYWHALMVVRKTLERQSLVAEVLSNRLHGALKRLGNRNRRPRSPVPTINKAYEIAGTGAGTIPESLKLAPGMKTTLRKEMGRVLHFYNKATGGAFLTASADLLSSTSLDCASKDFPQGFYHSVSNPLSRILSLGGICEDAMTGIMSGISSFGFHIGVCSSYGAFIAALGHIASRLHAIGNQARKSLNHQPYTPFILICAHVGVKTGEDGPTHADPQPLQLLQNNFPKGTLITLTPWDPQEIWPLFTTALSKRPAVICPFVTRPQETIIDRKSLGINSVTDVNSGVYILYPSRKKTNISVVLQGSDVANVFVLETLPLLLKEGIDITVFYVASAELFDVLPDEEKEKIYPEKFARNAMGITGFTMETMNRWILSEYGRRMSLHPYLNGHFPGSGQADLVLREAGLDSASQFKSIRRFYKKKMKL